ncbi:MAG: DUF1223 domain-containing protein [Maritimibacter sp.]
MRHWMKAAILACVGLAGSTAWAQDARPLVVLELFTSQGCNSCPPADEMLSELATREDVLPLALHVDYWDYIGWADKFARPQHTSRQKAYARAAHQGSIYTPQIVIGGTRHVVGFKPMKVMDALETERAALGDVMLSAQMSEAGTLSVAVEMAPGATPQRPLTVDLVSYIPEETVRIKHGENAGKTIEYANIVSDWTSLKKWDGAAPLSFSAKVPTQDKLAVIVQETGAGRILAAVALR